MSDVPAELKAAVYLSVAKLVEAHARELGVATSPSFVASLVELVYNQLVALGEDVELFANHAGRTTVTAADVYMAARKNDVLCAALREHEKKS